MPIKGTLLRQNEGAPMEILFVHDLIPWPKPLKKTRSRVIALKNQGCFHSEIAKRVCITKSTSVEICKRNASEIKFLKTFKGTSPFGYIHFKGKLLMETREMIVVHNILQLHQSGYGLSAITQNLNDKKVKPRSGITLPFGRSLSDTIVIWN